MIRITVQGWRGISHSYAMVNQFQLLELLKRTDVALSHEDMPFYNEAWKTGCSAGFSAAAERALAQISAPGSQRPDVLYRITFPYRFSGAAAERVFVFATTEHQHLHDHMVDRAHRAPGDIRIITPSQWSKQGFVRFGFPENWVHVVPHGIDPALFYPLTVTERVKARSAIGFTCEHFVFLNIGALTNNKGVDILVRAFAIIRQKYRGAVLLLKDARALYAMTAEDTVSEIINAHGLDPAVRDAIAVIPDNLDLGQMRRVYGMADAYVSPYRAEGFNLPPLEAAACGLPVLLTQGGATDDYVHPSFAIPITAQPSTKDQDHWLEPELESVVAGMEALIERRTGCDSSKAIPWIAENFSWAKAVDKLLRVLAL